MTSPASLPPPTSPASASSPTSAATLPSHLSPASINYDNLARDMVLFIEPGVFTHDEVFGPQGYGLTRTELELIKSTQEFTYHYDKWVKTTTSSGKALAREQARILFATNIRNLHLRLQDPETSLSQVTGAMSLLADIADLQPKKDDQTSGLTVVLDFGKSMNETLRPVIEQK